MRLKAFTFLSLSLARQPRRMRNIILFAYYLRCVAVAVVAVFPLHLFMHKLHAVKYVKHTHIYFNFICCVHVGVAVGSALQLRHVFKPCNLHMSLRSVAYGALSLPLSLSLSLTYCLFCFICPHVRVSFCLFHILIKSFAYLHAINVPAITIFTCATHY